MPEYLYTGAYPAAFPYETSDTVYIERGGEKTDALTGSTVYLHPGDVLFTADPIGVHAWLVPADGSDFADAVDVSEVSPAKTSPSGPPVETTKPPVVVPPAEVTPTKPVVDTKEDPS